MIIFINIYDGLVEMCNYVKYLLSALLRLHINLKFSLLKQIIPKLEFIAMFNNTIIVL